MYTEEHFRRLEALYAQAGAETAALEQLHHARLHCAKGCSACCVDGIDVFGIEAEYIRRHHADLLQHGTPNPPVDSACAFLDSEGACRIYAHRPLVCRMFGLPQRRIVQYKKKNTEVRDICPLNAEGKPLDELKKNELLDVDAPEDALALLQLEADGGSKDRVRLRKLFADPGGEK